ncbi:UNVERIFIED_CONTAM: hypothetical protein Sindi_0747900, partial [Sesamum indicum]
KWKSRLSLSEDELPTLPPNEAPSRELEPQKRDQATARQTSLERTKNYQALLLAVDPPRHSPSAPHILTEAIQLGIKIPSISESDETEDP